MNKNRSILNQLFKLFKISPGTCLLKRDEPDKERKQKVIQNIHSSQSEPIQQSKNTSFKRGSNAGSKYMTIFVKWSLEVRGLAIESERKRGLFKIISIVLLVCMRAHRHFCCFSLLFARISVLFTEMTSL